MIRRISACIIFLIVFWQGPVQACSISDREETEIGPFRAIRGVCSTSRRPVTCIFKGGEGMNCEGPSGSFTGLDLNGLVSAACGCSIHQYEYQEMAEFQEKQPCDHCPPLPPPPRFFPLAY